MKFYTANRETGTLIEPVSSIEEGYAYIERYEKEDKENGFYEENYYCVVIMEDDR